MVQATLTVRPSFTGPILYVKSKAASLTPNIGVKVKAKAGTCASWKGLDMFRHDVVAVPGWTRPPAINAGFGADSYQHGSESKAPDVAPSPASKTGPKSAMPDPAQEQAVANAFFGAPVSEPTVTQDRMPPAHPAPSAPAPPPALTDVYTYPGPNPFVLEASSRVFEDEEEAPKSMLV